jgi:hypothetical protein
MQLTFFENIDCLVKDMVNNLTIRHNANGNQKQLDDNRLHFTQQAQWVLEQLLKGRDISGLTAWKEFNIQDTRARIFSLRKAGLLISERRIEGAHGSKEWYMDKQQIEINKKLLGML